MLATRGATGTPNSAANWSALMLSPTFSATSTMFKARMVG